MPFRARLFTARCLQHRVAAFPRAQTLFSVSRHLSSAANETTRSGPRISTVVAALLCLGIGTTAYGVYDFYTSMTLWPTEVRTDLRAGIKAKHQGDLALSERYLRRAWETAQTLPPQTFAPDPFLKVSGIGIALAGVLEAHDAPKEAYAVYADVFQVLERQQQQQKLGLAERLRAIAVASKLGEMAEEYQLPAEEEERWLSWAVMEVLNLAKDVREGTVEGGRGGGSRMGEGEGEVSTVVLSELDLPSWVSIQDIGAPFEALGSFYARAGNVEYAVPLYLQAISMLVSPPANKPFLPEDTCRAVLLMNNLSELVIRNSPTPEKLQQAEKWARQALAVIEKLRGSIGSQAGLLPTTCEQALAVVLFNLGSLREMANDHSEAREIFTAGLNQSKAIGMKQGIMEARAALHRLDRSRPEVKNDSLENRDNAS